MEISLTLATTFNASESLKPKRYWRKVIMLGGTGVGKSAIIVQFNDNKFYDYYDPSFPAHVKKIINFNDRKEEVELIRGILYLHPLNFL